MTIEYEAKFLDINVKEMRKKLESFGAIQEHKKMLYKRAVYFLCDDKVRGYVRVRKEGKKVTMTTKIIAGNYPKEYEVTINNTFSEGVAFLKAIGSRFLAYQETMREKWKHPLAHEITFDTVPGLPTYMEIDCDSEEKLNKLIDLLQLDLSKKRFGTYDHTYSEYYGMDHHDINFKTPSLSFYNIENEIKPVKNIELFQKISKRHRKMAEKIKNKKINKKNKCKK